jgi:hypothetical protein
VVDQRERQGAPRRALQAVAAGQQGAQDEAGRHLPLRRRDELLGERGGQEAEGDPLGGEPGEEALRQQAHLLVGDVQARPRGQAGPDLPH